MSFANPDERNYGGAYYPRAPGSAHGPPPPTAGGQSHHSSSPEQRLHSSGGYKPTPAPHESPSQPVYPNDIGPPPGSAHGYPPQPITPLSGQTYPPQQPPSGGYYGITQTPQSDSSQPPIQQHIPSPPPSSNGRPASANFTPDGVPIVPVGVSGGKMFRCRGYGECDKVFTRSEHLARHVRKHTGERPFPCHCGKAFSRLDNLRQHAATVHADQSALNEAMLASLAPVHAALSQRANRDQRKRGEVVEVPKNAVERPRHAEYRAQKTSPGGSTIQHQLPPPDSPYAQYPPDAQWGAAPPQHARPRTSGYDYPPYSAEGPPVLEDAGPSRRPASSAGYGYQQPPYYDQNARPPTAPGTGSSGDSISQLPYPYRPMSSQGRDIPVPSHYAESEPPSTAHGPPQSPMYSNVPPAQWSSPPPPNSAYPPQDPNAYPPPSADGYAYPSQHGSYPPREEVYNYPPNWTPQQQYGNVPPPPPTAGGYPPTYNQPPPESPFQYNAPAPAPQDASYPPSYGYDARKRRADDQGGDPELRKHFRPNDEPQNLNAALEGPVPVGGRDPSWLPPTTERRSSLAISALLGSPQQASRSRPATAGGADTYDHAQAAYQASQAYQQDSGATTSASQSLPPTPAIGVNGVRKARDDTAVGGVSGNAVAEDGQSMEQKAKALLGQGR
ncbi:uncharacterized protein I303_103028 [Kwoniella dejecticola CBS 10117]|uniref:RNA polymerase II transcription factor n=1 Tax=Kwoniella dejecticola CBS 10117 TaxID=1296121 RepID=A0A1A6AAE2_9TREE|nr:RNA polymerase II transcription factor [Kwoniella dejecticola CBS 10117]OBR87026.1 RNA polymerase II transcription factor [Kwoniella dejecticola CBS 10117]